jgi:hypothetical protein
VPVPGTKRRPLPLLGAVIVVGRGSLTLAACNSGESSSAGGGAAAADALKAPISRCQQIGGVLADGPDPDGAPVGATLNQILPLRDIHSSETSVSQKVAKLVSADQALYDSNGTNEGAATASKNGEAVLNKACRGVAA